VQRWSRTIAIAIAWLAASGSLSIAAAQADTAAQAQTPVSTRAEVEQEASKLFNKVMSPFCPGRTIANCPSPQAAELQVTIKERLQRGESPDSIEEELYATFGDEMRAIPRARGFNLLAWAIPGLFFALGLAVLARWLRGLGPTAAPAGAAPVSIDAAMDERLEKELEEIDD